MQRLALLLLLAPAALGTFLDDLEALKNSTHSKFLPTVPVVPIIPTPPVLPDGCAAPVVTLDFEKDPLGTSDTTPGGVAQPVDGKQTQLQTTTDALSVNFYYDGVILKTANTNAKESLYLTNTNFQHTSTTPPTSNTGFTLGKSNLVAAQTTEVIASPIGVNFNFRTPVKVFTFFAGRPGATGNLNITTKGDMPGCSTMMTLKSNNAAQNITLTNCITKQLTIQGPTELNVGDIVTVDNLAACLAQLPFMS